MNTRIKTKLSDNAHQLINLTSTCEELFLFTSQTTPENRERSSLTVVLNC